VRREANLAGDHRQHGTFPGVAFTRIPSSQTFDPFVPGRAEDSGAFWLPCKAGFESSAPGELACTLWYGAPASRLRRVTRLIDRDGR